MVTAQQVLDQARAELGYVEGPNNDTKYGRWYGMNHQPWCAMFVSWVADKAGATAIIPKHAYTPAGANWFKGRGEWGSKPTVGAIVYYDISGLGRISHVGIVEKVLADGSFHAIEGNTDGAGSRTGGQVMRKHRKNVGKRGGFGYPAYTNKTPDSNQSEGSIMPGTSAVGRSDDSIDVFYVKDGKLKQKFWRSGEWQGPTPLGAPPKVTLDEAAPGVSVRHNGDSIDVFALGSDGNLWQIYWRKGAGWSPWSNKGKA